MVFTQEQVDASESLRTSDGDRIACKDAPGGNGRKGDSQDIKAADASPPPAAANAGAKPVDPLEAANRKIAALERRAGCEGCPRWRFAGWSLGAAAGGGIIRRNPSSKFAWACETRACPN